MKRSEYNFFELSIKHKQCWTSLVPDYYQDVLVGYTYINSMLKATRISKYYTKGDIQSIRKAIKADKSIKSVQIYNIDNTSSVISMDTNYKEAFIAKLVKKSIFPLKSSVSKNYENYIFMHEEENLNKFMDSLKNDNIEIVHLKELKYNKVIPELSNFLIDIFLTEKEKAIIKMAKENKYFNIPRGSTNTSIAKDLNISKMAINIEIRKALNKIMDKIYI